MSALQVAIAGAGIGGLTAALCLRQRGLAVTLLEQAPELGEVGAGIQLSPNAMQVLQELGLGAALAEVACEPQAASLRHWRTGKAYLTLPLRQDCVARYGAPYLHIHRADLIAVLRQSALAAGVNVRTGQTVTGYRQDSDAVAVQLAGGSEQGGSEEKADLLVGADGMRSAVRLSMLGERPLRFTGQAAWRGTVPVERLPSAALPQEANVWIGPRRHFVCYHLRGGTQVSFFAVAPHRSWTAEDLSQRGDVKELRAAFGDWDGRIGELLAACDSCTLWGLFDLAPLPRWSDGRVVLLGDACHPMLPFMAQGGAMAIEDAYVLAALVSARRARDEAGLAAALAAYERLRKPRTSMLQARSRANERLFHLSHPVPVAGRACAMAVARLLPAVPRLRLDRIYGVNVCAGRAQV